MPNAAHVLVSSASAPQRKRRQVLDAASSLFMAQGYGATSMDAVAREAGVSKATLYAYFSGKDALFAAIVGEACSRHAEAGETGHAEDAADVAEALREIGRGYLSFLFRQDVLAIWRVVMAEGPRFPELGRAFFESGPMRLLGWFSGWVRRRQEAGALGQGEPMVMAEQFLALLRTSAFMRRMLGLPAADDAASEAAAIEASVEAAVATFLAAFGSRPARS